MGSDDAGNESTRVIDWIRDCRSPIVNLMDDDATKATGMIVFLASLVDG